MVQDGWLEGQKVYFICFRAATFNVDQSVCYFFSSSIVSIQDSEEFYYHSLCQRKCNFSELSVLLLKKTHALCTKHKQMKKISLQHLCSITKYTANVENATKYIIKIQAAQVNTETLQVAHKSFLGTQKTDEAQVVAIVACK